MTTRELRLQVDQRPHRQAVFRDARSASQPAPTPKHATTEASISRGVHGNRAPGATTARPPALLVEDVALASCGRTPKNYRVHPSSSSIT